MSTTAQETAPHSAEPWRRRLLRGLLYGNNINRAAKARARVGLAILVFAAVYCIIAARLVMFAVIPDSRVARHGPSGEGRRHGAGY